MTVSPIMANSPSMTAMSSAIDQLNTQNTSLQAALASGVASDSYAGLGAQRYQALSLQPEITDIGAWQQNVTAAQANLSITQTALTQIAAIGTALQTSLTSLQGNNSATAIDAAATQAKLALSQLASLANTKSGDSYVFAGTQSDTAPVTDPDNILTSATVDSIGASVASVATSGAAATIAATVAAASSNVPGLSLFAPALSVDPVTATASTRTVTVGNSDRLPVGFVLTQGATAGGSSTGSSIRDLIRELAVVASLPSGDSSSADFSDLVNDTASSITATNASLVQTQSQVGETQDELTNQATSLSMLSDALTQQLGNAKDTDPTALSTALATNKAQLTASYTLIADMKGLTLASFL